MLRGAFSLVINRLLIAAFLIFLAHNYAGKTDGFADSLSVQVTQWFGLDQLYRSFDHDDL